MSCAYCGAPMVPQKRWQAGMPARPHTARGLCHPCYQALRKADALIDYERPTRSREEVIEEWDLLRSEGHTLRQAAERLGMTYAALRKAVQRARVAA